MYNVDYFIDKFEAIPKDNWCTDLFNFAGASCALGHCGAKENALDTEESTALWILFDTDSPVTDINDGKDPYSKLGNHPKDRVINALKKMRK